MKHLLILSSGLFLIIACGNPNNSNNEKNAETVTKNTEMKIPNDLTYIILEETPNDAISKCNLNIQLSRKISKIELTALANELRSTRENYDRLWIFYTLDNMKIDAGAWATTHFTPELDVQILGATAEEEKSSNELSKNIDGAKTLGTWFEQQYTSSTHIYYEKNGKFYVRIIFKDKSSMDSEVKKRKVKNGLRLEDVENTNGEYYIISKNGELEFYNHENKKFTTGQIVK
jgi:hypothetical protein